MQSVSHPWFNNLFCMLHWRCVYMARPVRWIRSLHLILCSVKNLILSSLVHPVFVFNFEDLFVWLNFQKVGFLISIHQSKGQLSLPWKIKILFLSSSFFLNIWQRVTTINIFYYGVFTALKGMRWYIVVFILFSIVRGVVLRASVKACQSNQFNLEYYDVN